MKQAFFVGFLIPILSIYSCKKSNLNNTQTSTTPLGCVRLWTANDGMIKNDTGIIVLIQNSDTTITEITNNQGNFKLPKLNVAGTVTITYSYPGFSTFKNYFTPAEYDSTITDLGCVNLFPPSLVVVNSLSALTIQNDTLNVMCNVSFPLTDSPACVRFFFKTNPNVSYNNFIDTNQNLATNFSYSFPVTNGNNLIQFPLAGLSDMIPGQTLYTKVYGDLYFFYSYVDIATNEIVLPCVNPNSNSATLSFVVP